MAAKASLAGKAFLSAGGDREAHRDHGVGRTASDEPTQETYDLITAEYARRNASARPTRRVPDTGSDLRLWAGDGQVGVVGGIPAAGGDPRYAASEGGIAK